MRNFKGSVAVIGAGSGGSAFLSVLIKEPEIDVIGISDTNPDAPGLKTARKHNIPTTDNFRELLDKKPDIVINVTGNEGIQSELLKYKTGNTEIIDGKSAKLVWDLLRKHQEAKDEIKTLLNATKELYRIGISLLSADKLEDVLDNLLTEACRTLDAPAGSIALYNKKNGLLTLKAAHGFSLPFSQVAQWKVRDGGMTAHILSKRVPTIISDVDKNPFVDNKVLLKEGIKSLIAIPLFANEQIIGILYLDDFKPREWTERELEFTTLLGIEAAYAIEKFSLIETVSETQTYLKNVLNNSADIIITTDNEGLIVEFNTGASRILGYNKEEVIGINAADLWIEPEKRKDVLKALEKDGYISNYETRLKARDGRVIDISLTLAYIKNGDGRIHGTVGISKDITEKKRLEKAVEEKRLELQELNEKLEERVIERTRELERANRELEKTNKLKSQFIATMSHELRTPLNSILGFSDLLLMDELMGEPLTEKQKDCISNIYNSGSHLLHLINNILDIAKIEAGKMEIHYENFPVPQALSEVEQVIKPLSDKRKQKLSISISDRISFIKADKVKFKQILYNLLSNAVKFTPERGDVFLEAELVSINDIYPQVKDSDVCTEDSECLLKISVIDTGIGIKKEDHKRIFSEFEQVDSSLSRRYEGTGLGLSLTKRLVELHGGELSIESDIGKGSKFTVLLPIFDTMPVKKATEEFKKPEIKELAYNIPSMKNRRGESPMILVVEDDRATSELLTLYLAKEGYRVTRAYTGDEAVARIRELKPFAVILDVMLPGKDGWEILQEVKSDNELKDIPVIMSSIIDNQELGFALGASDYIVKPIDRTNLLKKLEEINLPSKMRSGPINVLCIDDHEDTLKLLTSMLEPSGYAIITANSGMDGIEKAFKHRPDLIILDLMMPEVDGFEVAQALKDNNATMHIPILILTAKDLTMEDRFRLVGKAEDFIQKSHFTKEDLLMHIKDLEAVYPVRAGLLDEVSGLFDHCYFHIRLAQEAFRGERYNNFFTILMIDIDNFTEYVKTYGIHRGNLIIRKTAEFLRKSMRSSDTIVRYGTDEFALILLNTTKENAEPIARRFISSISAYPFHGDENMPRHKITASASLISFPGDASSPEELIFKAHQALKEAKSAGGGRVRVYGQ